MNARKGKILVHCCCGPCSTWSLRRLIDEGWEPVVYYGNSNIWPESENEKRWEELLKVAARYGLEVHRERYDHGSWLDAIKGLEDQPEGAGRCLKCFEYNLRQAWEEARQLGIGHFTTTLTVSRYKNSGNIFNTGRGFEGFEEIDFKKNNGYAQSVKMSKEMGLYRQKYCGCEFSMGTEE